jgi:glycosyltransferase involved in cell wall biosynthesis
LQGVVLALIIGCLGNSWIMDFTSGYFLVTFIALFTAGLSFHSSYTKNRFSPYRFSLLDMFSHSPTTSRPTISVIITTYNWPSALNLVMQALSKQTVLPAEILIADDGSTQETKEIIDQIKTQFPIPVQHIWQPDEGFRASAIRNKALAKASGDYIVFMDGDCIPRDNFIEMHGKLAEPGFFVAGNRSLLTQNFTAKLLSQATTVQAQASQTFNASVLFSWSLFQCFLVRLQGHCNRFLPFLTLPGHRWRKRNPTQWEGAKGCNLGIWKMDLIRINGWEERFSGWGFEDSDLVIRLIRIGIRRKDGRFALPVIHLWHSENDRSRQKENWNLLLATQHKQRWVAEQGLDEMRTAHGT